jgi:hypothetical protein
VATVEAQAGAERAALIDSIEAMLRPLMPLVLNYGVTYADAQEILRALFIETMGDRIRQQGREASVGRIAVMAGLNRGEVVKLLSERDAREVSRQRRVSQFDDAARVLNTWYEDPRFNTPYGAPLDLSLDREQGFKCLADLIAVACPDADAELLVDELIAANSVEVHGGKFIRPTSRAFTSNASDTAVIARLGRQMSALANTFVLNIVKTESDQRYPELSVTTSLPVNTEFLSKARGYFMDQGQEFLNSVDRWVTDNEKPHSDLSGAVVGMGLYFYEEKRPKPTPPLSNG